MNKEQVAKMLSDDRAEWDRLVVLLDAHPNVVVHGPPSPPWMSRDVYAHLARWLDYSNHDMESYLAGRPVSAAIDDIEGINARWQKEDSGLSLTEACLRAHRAFANRLALVASIPLDRWDKELERIASYDGSSHLSLHRGYIHLGSGNSQE